MLILSRRINESIVILDGEIKITVIGVNGCQVRLAIDAPKNITVDREEIHKRKIAEAQGE